MISDTTIPVGIQIDGVKFRSEHRDNVPPGEAFAVWRTTRVGRVLENNVRPTLEDGFRNVKFPAHSLEERQLILIDLKCIQTRNFAPRSGGVISILEILRGQNKRRKEHSPATLHSTRARVVPGLLHGEILFRYMRLNHDKIVQGNLKSRIAGS